MKGSFLSRNRIRTLEDSLGWVKGFEQSAKYRAAIQD